MGKGFRVRDPVHNFVELRDKEVKLLGTPLVQRLRGIRQLALANLVYPGALHTRFDHSLGVCHVAGLMAEQIGLSSDEVRLVRLSALLHDVGHGPFSHVSEIALQRYADPEALSNNQKKDKIHEVITGHLISNDPEIVRVLGQDTCAEIVSLLAEGHGAPVLRSMVSGPLDADKQDYLLRDSHFCGVPYGVFDIHQLHRSLVSFGPDDAQELMIAPDGISAVEQFVLAKYYMTANVYRHRVRLITDQMIARAISLGVEEDELPPLCELYRFDNSPRFIERYASWDDARFLLEFGEEDNSTLCGALLQRLRTRRLHKRVYSGRVDHFPEARVREEVMKLNRVASDALRRKMEVEVAQLIKEHTGQEVDPRLVIVYAFDYQSLRTAPRDDESSIIVARASDRKTFEDESPLFASLNEGYRRADVEVYAPVDWPTRTDRHRFRNALNEPIKSLITDLSYKGTEEP